MFHSSTRPWRSWSRPGPCLVALLVLAGCPRERLGGAHPALPELVEDEGRHVVAAEGAQDEASGAQEKERSRLAHEPIHAVVRLYVNVLEDVDVLEAGPHPSPASARVGLSSAGPDDRRSGASGEKVARAPAGSARRVRPPPWLRFGVSHDLVRLRTIPVTMEDAVTLRARLGKRIRLRKVRFYEAVRDDRIVAVASRSVQGGRHASIHFAVYLDREGKVARVQVIELHEVRGAAVAEERFLSQYVGKVAHDPIRVGADVDAITGATISSKAVTRGVRKAVVLWERFYRQ